LGVETDVLTRGFGETAVVTRPVPGVRVFHLPCGWTKGSTDREDAWRSLPRFVASARILLGAGNRYDAASAHYWMSAIAARALSGESGRRARAIPAAFCFHTVEARKIRAPGTIPGSFAGLRMAAEREIAGSVDSLVCLSSYDLAETVRCYPDAGPRGTVIPPGVDERFTSPPGRESARIALGRGAAGTLFLLAARDDSGKNTASAVEAVRRLRASNGGADVELIVAGSERPPGTEREVGVTFAGAVPHEAMAAYYAAADAVVCPSLYESFGLVPLEALAAGTPVIAPETVYWGKRLRTEGGGLAYDPADPGALAAAMGRFLAGDGLRERLSAESRRVAAPFTWPRCAASWASLLSRLSTRDGRPGIPRAPAAPRRR
ncbi:MAG TPA: glycosyltransferase, partial [Candidatus Deferrimicrobiaceae bacterium]